MIKIKLTSEEILLLELEAKAIPKTTEIVKDIYVNGDLDTLIEDLQALQALHKDVDDKQIVFGTMYIAGFDEECLQLVYEVADNQEKYLEDLKRDKLEEKQREYSHYLILKKKYEGEK